VDALSFGHVFFKWSALIFFNGKNLFFCTRWHGSKTKTDKMDNFMLYPRNCYGIVGAKEQQQAKNGTCFRKTKLQCLNTKRIIKATCFDSDLNPDAWKGHYIQVRNMACKKTGANEYYTYSLKQPYKIVSNREDLKVDPVVMSDDEYVY
jgi:hypothetical protein